MSTQQNSNTWQPDGTFTTSNIFFSNRNPDEEKQTILDWLTPLDFDSQQKEFLEKSLSGTVAAHVEDRVTALSKTRGQSSHESQP